MGLFSSGGKGNSTPTTNTASTTNNTSTTVNQVDNRAYDFGEGPAVVGDNNYVVSTDFNAIGSATALAQSALDASEASAAQALKNALAGQQTIADLSSDLTQQSIAGVTKFGDLAFSSVDKALGAVSGAYGQANQSIVDVTQGALGDVQAANKNALDVVTSANESALDKLSKVFSDSFANLTDFVGGLQKQAGETLNDSVTAINKIAAENNTSSDQRVQSIAETSIKYVGLAVVAIAILFAFSRKKA